MANTIKGLTVEIGGDTTKLGKALEEVNKKSRDLSSELGQINKLLKLDPGNADLLAQKQKVLADAVSNTSEKLKTLKEAEKQVQAQFEKGEVSEAQVRELQREIITTTKKLESYEKAAKETAEAIERLGEESEDAADEIKDVGKQADKAEKEADDLGDTLENSTGVGLTTVIGLATAAVGAIVGCIEASADYRREMGKLSTAFETNGFSAEVAERAYKDLQGIIGETDQTVEAVNHLAELVDTEEELAHWTGDILPGVYAKFGASLQPEALTEAANETAKNSTVTGALADALNWAAEEGETFGVALKEATEENEEWNKAVEEATTAEDFFNLALQECSSEQERQQLITKTLTKMYGKAAAQYKKTNKQVIESNEATEEWNATVAELGEEMAPVMTEIKKFGTSLLENAKEPLKDIADFLVETVLPGLSNLSRWVSNNTPIITAGIVAVTTTIIAYKAAVIAAEVAQKGLKAAILATTAAEKALQIAQAATPWGLVAVAVAAVVAGLVAYAIATEDTVKKTDVLTEAERELMAAADETAESFREQQKATNETLGGITSQMSHTQSLADELRKLADASGKVNEKDQERANFILNELNEALGTEYTMVDGVIQQYDDLKNSIDQVIQSKLANSLLEAANADYVAAIQAEEQALENLLLKEKDYQNQLTVKEEAEKAYYDALAAYQEKAANAKDQYDWRALAGEAQRVAGLANNLNEEEKLLGKKKSAYDQASADYGNYATTINNYEDAQAAVLSGNYDQAVDLLKRKGGAYIEYSDKVDAATAAALDALFKEAVDAGIAAENTKKNFEKGVAGYTKEMVEEAEKGYEDALNAYSNAYADAESAGKDLGGGLVGGVDLELKELTPVAKDVGEDLGSGLSEGMENKRSGLLSKAKSLVSGIISAMKKEADSNSPSKKTMAFGEDMGEGAEIGIESKTKDVARAAERQVGAILNAYREQETEGQTTLRSIAERQTTRQVTDQMAVASVNSDVLGEILTAIKDGQVLVVDGDKLVGATINKTDSALGQRRVLITRGAL